MNKYSSNLLPLPERVIGEAVGTYLNPRESWIQLKADYEKTAGNIYYLLFIQALLCPSVSFKTY